MPWPEAIEVLPTVQTALLAMTTGSPISVAQAAVANKVKSDTAAQTVRETMPALEAVASFGGTSTDSGRESSLKPPELSWGQLRFMWGNRDEFRNHRQQVAGARSEGAQAHDLLGPLVLR